MPYDGCLVSTWFKLRTQELMAKELSYGLQTCFQLQTARATRRPPSSRCSAAFSTGKQHQVLLGVTGSGKTFTMAKVIEPVEPADAGDGA